MDHEFGVLTLATPKDYKKAVGLACSIKLTSPGVPVAVTCCRSIAQCIGKYFDNVIIEKEGIRGFAHKLFLDEYTPYEKTFFLDADILLYRNITEIFNRWKGSPYAVRGYFPAGGVSSSFGLDRDKVLSIIGKSKFSCIDGAGHAYFEKPACCAVFDKAREIMNDYHRYAGECRLADEDVMGIAMTMLDIPPKENQGFMGSPWHAAKGRAKEFDVLNKHCRYFDKQYGDISPYAAHFMHKATPFLYAGELTKLFKEYHVTLEGLWIDALKDKLTTDFLWPLLKIRKVLYNNLFKSLKKGN